MAQNPVTQKCRPKQHFGNTSNSGDSPNTSDEVIAPPSLSSVSDSCIAGVGGPLAHGFRVDSSGRPKDVGYPRTWRNEKPVTQKHPYRDQRTITVSSVSYLSPQPAAPSNRANQKHSRFDDAQ